MIRRLTQALLILMVSCSTSEAQTSPLPPGSLNLPNFNEHPKRIQSPPKPVEKLYIHFKNKEYFLSEYLAARILESQPNNFKVRKIYADSLRYIKKHETAIKQYDLLIDQIPDDLDLKLYRGISCLDLMGDTQYALDCIQRKFPLPVSSRNENNIIPAPDREENPNLLKTNFKNREYHLTEYMAARILQSEPDNIEVRKIYADSLRYIGKHKSAIEQYNHLIDKTNNLDYVLYRGISCLELLGPHAALDCVRGISPVFSPDRGPRVVSASYILGLTQKPSALSMDRIINRENQILPQPDLSESFPLQSDEPEMGFARMDRNLNQGIIFSYDANNKIKDKTDFISTYQKNGGLEYELFPADEGISKEFPTQDSQNPEEPMSTSSLIMPEQKFPQSDGKPESKGSKNTVVIEIPPDEVVRSVISDLPNEPLPRNPDNKPIVKKSPELCEALKKLNQDKPAAVNYLNKTCGDTDQIGVD